MCRFISADSFDYIDADTLTSINAYVYCYNNPAIFSDPEGTHISSGQVPPESSGYVPPKGGARKVPIPGNNSGEKGWLDNKGNVWYPDKKHGDHWDVVNKSGTKHRNVYPDGHERNSSQSSALDLGELLGSFEFEISISNSLSVAIVGTLLIIILLFTFGPILIPLV